jgi:ketosteroid isomerase-like protein
MTTMVETGHAFFKACEEGHGWKVCSAYCAPGATFSAQAAPLDGITTLQGYTDWMQGLLTVLTDGHYVLKSFATDTDTNTITAYAVFIGTHLAGGPCAPTGKTTHTDYVYVMQFAGEKIAHMTKIWNAAHTLGELGWA